MNGPAPARPDRGMVGQLLDALRLRQATAPTPARAATIAELAAALESGEEEVGPLPDLVEIIERTSLGRTVARERRRRTPAAAVADVLARADRLAVQAESAAGDGPVADWSEELWRLWRESTMSREKLLVELEGMGFALTTDALDALLAAPPVFPDREVVRSMVTVLGGDWTSDGYEACYDAALDEQRRIDGTLAATVGRQDVSGLAGADPLTPSTLLRQVEPEFGLLPPVVRGRDVLVEELVSRLEAHTGAPVLLTGPAGSGKSTVALTIAAAARDRGHLVWWVRARDPNQVKRGMLAVATQLGGPVSELNAIQSDPEHGAELLWGRLDGSSTPWLLVFDDTDDPDLLAVPGADAGAGWARPSAAGTVLVTSRVREPARWAGPAVHVAVGDLPAEEGARVVLDRMRRGTDTTGHADDLAHARLLSERLGGVALALRTVGGYLGSGLVDQDIAELAGALPPEPPAAGDGPGRLVVAWKLAVDGLAARGMPEARTLLRMLACYAPHWVVPLDVIAPEELPRCGLPVPLVETSDSLGAWRRALDGLREVGLVSHNRTAGAQVPGIVLHPLVAEVSLTEAGPDDSVDAAAVQLLLNATEGLDAGRPATWPALRRLEPHVYALLDNLETSRPQVQGAALQLADRIAEGLIRAGLFALGEALVRHAQDRTRQLGPHAPESLAAEHTLAWALGLRGGLAESEDRFRRLLGELRRIGRSDEAATLAARDHLAWVLAEQGRLDEAHRLFRELLPVTERVLGPEHRDTLAVRHRIAWITALRGRPDDAEAQFARLLPRRLAALEPDHMEVLSSRYRLAWARCLQGRSVQAEQDFLGLLHDVEQVFAADSASVIMVRARLGWTRTWLGRFAEAEADYRVVLEARARVLGAHHPRTLRARHDLACVMAGKGDHRGAERIYREVLAEVDRTPELGRDHPLALDARGRLTQLLVEIGRLDEAERRARALVTHRRRVSGPEHPATLVTRRTLARALAARGRLGEAERYLEVVLADQERLLGGEHRHTLDTRALLGETIGRRGRLSAAQQVIEEVLVCRTEVFGPDHPHTLASREQLVWMLGERDQLVEAQERCRALIADRRRALGALHPDTLAARYRLGWLLALDERGPEAAQTFRALVADQHAVLGREHPHTLRTRHGLAHELLRAGRYADGEQELRSVLIDRIPLLGRRHPDTLTNRHSLAFAMALRGALNEAERSMHAVLFEQLEAFGPDHRHTLATRERLGWIQARQGRLEDAADNWRQLVDDRARLLDPDHPDTLRARQRQANFPHEVARWW